MKTALNFEKIWQLFQETDRKFQEMQQAWDHSFQETRREFQASQQALDRRFQETDKKMKGLQDLFEGQWGKLMESLVERNLVHLLDERGVQVKNTSTWCKGSQDGESYEFDIIAHNGQEIVIVEVQMTLRVGQVEKFIKRLHRVKQYLPEYSSYWVFGAVAYLRAEQASDRYAQNQRLFVIRATGDSAAIVNPADFWPRAFG